MQPRTPITPPVADTAIDNVFFVFGGVAAVWLSYLVVRQSFGYGWWQLAIVVVFWVLLAYLVLPRLHRILTRIYVPDYFIGRARTSDGLLGDPVNLAWLGSEAQLHATMIAAGWTRADDLSFRTGGRIVRSTLVRRSYPEAPVSPLLLFGRQQDFAYQQEVNGSPGKRHHVRFWRCPPAWKLPGGRSAEWLAAGTYDRRVGLSLFTLQVTHKIAPDTDVERDHIVRTVLAAEPDAKVHRIRDFSTGYHARNGGGDAIETDGDLPVVDLRDVSTGAASDEPETDSRDKRPGATIVGAAFVAARAVEAAATSGLALLALISPALPDQDRADLAPVVAVTGLYFLVEGALVWRIFLGSNRARVIAMALSTLAILAQAVTIVIEGSPAVVSADLPGISLDVLLILALSSERALQYARRRRKVPKRISGRPGDVAAF